MTSIAILVTITISFISLCESKTIKEIKPAGGWIKVIKSEYPKLMKYLFEINKMEVDPNLQPTITGAEYQFVSGKKYKVSIKWDQGLPGESGDECPEGKFDVTFQVTWNPDDAPVFLSADCIKE